MDPWFIRTELTEPLLDDARFPRGRGGQGTFAKGRRAVRRQSGRRLPLFGALCHRTNIVCGRGPDLQRLEYRSPPRRNPRGHDIAGGMGGLFALSPPRERHGWIGPGSRRWRRVGGLDRTDRASETQPSPYRGAPSTSLLTLRRHTGAHVRDVLPLRPAVRDVPLSMRTVPALGLDVAAVDVAPHFHI